MFVRKFLIYLFSILAAFSVCSCGGSDTTALESGDEMGREESENACFDWVADHGLVLLEVTEKNLPSAFSKYGVDSEGVVIIRSSVTEKLLEGDRVVSVNGVEVTHSCDIDGVVRALRSGDEIELVVKRGEKTLKIKYILGKRHPENVKFK